MGKTGLYGMSPCQGSTVTYLFVLWGVQKTLKSDILIEKKVTVFHVFGHTVIVFLYLTTPWTIDDNQPLFDLFSCLCNINNKP